MIDVPSDIRFVDREKISGINISQNKKLSATIETDK